MDPELTALLAAARLEIEDDAPRLVLADWLEEHGDEARAEWLRLSLRVSRLPEWHPQRPALDAHLAKLDEANERDWFGPLLKAPGVTQLSFAAGMVTLEVRPEALDGLERLLESSAGSWVDGLRCWGQWAGPDFARVLRSPAVARLASLGLGDYFYSDLVAALAESPHLSRLAHLIVRNIRLLAPGLRQVIDAGNLPALTRLGLPNNALGRPALEALGAAGWLDRLTSLDLSTNGLGISAARYCVGRQLRVLDVDMNSLGDRGVAALPAERLGALAVLNLGCNSISAEGLAALAGADGFGALTELHLDVNEVGDAGVEALARSPLAGRLRSLGLYSNGVGDAGAQALLDSHLRGGLHRLDLTGNDLSAGMKRKLKRAFGAALVK